MHEKRLVECEKCGWPICKKDCQYLKVHEENECQLTIQRNEKVKIRNFVSPHPSYSCLLVIRCLMLKEKDPKKWNKFLELQSSKDEKTPTIENGVENVAKFIQR